jgi:Fe-S-cluster containining protein
MAGSEASRTRTVAGRHAAVSDLAMEIEIDTSLVNAIVDDERALTRSDLAEGGPMLALERSQARHELRLAAAKDAPTLACKAGCFWCCYFTVDARPVEVLRIVDFMQRSLPEADRSRITNEIMTNSAAFAALDEEARAHSNTKCPFLHLGRCSIYSVRPQTCRNYHATNAAGCQKAYEEPSNDDIDPEFAPIVYQTGGAHVDAFSSALREAGYDVDAYELNMALAVALADPIAARRRFDAKSKAFPILEGVEVPSEFADR